MSDALWSAHHKSGAVGINDGLTYYLTDRKRLITCSTPTKNPNNNNMLLL